MIKLTEKILNVFYKGIFDALEEERQREQVLHGQKKAFKRQQEEQLNENLSKILDRPVDGLSSSQQNRDAMTKEVLNNDQLY